MVTKAQSSMNLMQTLIPVQTVLQAVKLYENNMLLSNNVLINRLDNKTVHYQCVGTFGQQSSYVKIIKCQFDKRIEARPQLCEIKRGLFRSLITRNTSHCKYL